MSNTLRYTSTNGRIVLPTTTQMEDGNRIVNNTYKGGVGTIEFADELTIIPKAFFRGAWTLETIIIPNSVRMIEDGAFEKCRHLKNVKLQDGLLSIGKRSFAGTGLERAIIPSSIVVVCSEAFSHCDNLTSVYFKKPKSACVIGERCFHFSPTNIEKAYEYDIFAHSAFDLREK